MKKSNSAQNALDLLVLTVLDRRAPLHGYGIANAIQELSREALRVDEGPLYPALHRMEEAGWISAEWMVTENKARVYRMTRAGTKQLAAETERCDVFSKGVARVLVRIPGARRRDGGGCINGCVFLAADGIGFGLSRFA